VLAQRARLDCAGYLLLSEMQRVMTRAVAVGQPAPGRRGEREGANYRRAVGIIQPAPPTGQIPRPRRGEGGGEGGELKAKIHVTLKQGILDPQGKSIEQALATLGYTAVSNVRVGKYLELDLNETEKEKAEAQLKAMCDKLLANTIIEEYRYELDAEC